MKLLVDYNLERWLLQMGFEIQHTGGGFFHYERVVSPNSESYDVIGDCLVFTTYGIEFSRAQQYAVLLGFRDEEDGFDFDAPTHEWYGDFSQFGHDEGRYLEGVKSDIWDALDVVSEKRIQMDGVSVMAGAPTLSACKEMLQRHIEQIDIWIKDGYELVGPVDQGIGWILKKNE